MNLNEYDKWMHQRIYNEGWNSAASSWDLTLRKSSDPNTSYSGAKRESFLEGFRACQDYLLLDEKLIP